MAKIFTMKDIANKVRVLPSLVSYVLIGLEKEKRVGPEVAEKIHSTAKELKYQSIQIAQSRRKVTTNTIGLIVIITQQRTIQGKVPDNQGSPLPGVKVVINSEK